MRSLISLICIQICPAVCSEKCPIKTAAGFWTKVTMPGMNGGRTKCKYLPLLDQISAQINNPINSGMPGLAAVAKHRVTSRMINIMRGEDVPVQVWESCLPTPHPEIMLRGEGEVANICTLSAQSMALNRNVRFGLLICRSLR